MLIPQRDLVYIRPIPDATKTQSGLYIPEQAQERMDQGIVKHIGPDVKDLEIGDYVVFPNYGGTLMHISGEGAFIIMKEEAVVAVLQHIAEDTFVPGLFFQDNKGEYFPANYEMIFELVAEAIANEPWYIAHRQALKEHHKGRYRVSG